MKIHNTAIIHRKAKLADDVKVGPYCVIGADVTIGAGTKIGPHCVIEGTTTIGKNNIFYGSASIGGDSQDLKYKGAKTYLEIGDNNTMREYVTLNRGTDEGGKTIIGSNNFFMAYTHVAHDCKVGNHCIMANGGHLGGHVELEDRVIIGGFGAVHQFCRVGELALLGGCSKLTQDLPPYLKCDGRPVDIHGINYVGLKRAGIDSSVTNALKKAYKILFREGLNTPNALKKIESELPDIKQIRHFVEFARASKRGICH